MWLCRRVEEVRGSSVKYHGRKFFVPRCALFHVRTQESRNTEEQEACNDVSVVHTGEWATHLYEPEYYVGGDTLPIRRKRLPPLISTTSGRRERTYMSEHRLFLPDDDLQTTVSALIRQNGTQTYWFFRLERDLLIRRFPRRHPIPGWQHTPPLLPFLFIQHR